MKTVETSITVKEFLEMVNKGYYLIRFEEYKETNDRNSLLIHSLIEGYPIVPFYFSRGDDGLYYSRDTSQNGVIISKYINGDFLLSKDTPSTHGKQCATIEIAEKYFSELSEEFQERILNYNLTIRCFEDVTDDDLFRIAYRVSHGKDLTEEKLKELKKPLTEEEREILTKKIKQMDQELYDNISNWKKIVDSDRIYEG